MTSHRTFAAMTIIFGLATFLHAILTWPLEATLALFGGGLAVAFLAEATVINLGWLEHRIGPKILGVPLYILPGWTGAVYVAFRAALLVADGWAAVAIAAVLATTYDILTDHRGVADGHWRYIDDLPGPRFRGVPWWNFVGWLAVSATTAALALPFI